MNHRNRIRVVYDRQFLHDGDSGTNLLTSQEII